MTTAAQIVEIARRELATTYPGIKRTGTRWQHQARILGVALDCVGLVGGVAVACGISESAQWLADDELKRYSRIPDPAVLLKGARRYMDEISLREIRAGDVLVLAHQDLRHFPTHFAIVTSANPLYVIHADMFHRRVVENRLDPDARWRPTHAFRFRGLE